MISIKNHIQLFITLMS